MSFPGKSTMAISQKEGENHTKQATELMKSYKELGNYQALDKAKIPIT